MSATTSTSTVSLTTTPVRVDQDALSYPEDAPFTVTNLGPNVIRVGDSTVTATSGGQRVHVGEVFRRVLYADSLQVWAVSTEATASAKTVQTAVFDTDATLLAEFAPIASPAFTGTPTVNGSPIGAGAVASVAGRTGAVVLANTDISGLGTASTHAATDFDTSGAASAEQTRALAAEALLAPLASPALTGNPTVPTQTALDASTKASSTAYADAAVGVEKTRAQAAEALALPKTGGTMSGAIAMGASKVTGLANGSGAQDGAAFGQIPTAGSAIPVPSVGGTAGSASTWMKSDAKPTRGYWVASDYGYLAMAYPPEYLAITSTAMAAGTVYVTEMFLDAIGTITSLDFSVATAGSGLTASQCGVAVFDASKTLIGTAFTADGATNLATALTSTGKHTSTLAATGTGLTSVAAGKLYAAMFQNGTTPAILRCSANTSAVNGNLSAANAKYASADTGRTTTFPTTLGAFTAFSGANWFAVF